jgi:hypothetical protein
MFSVMQAPFVRRGGLVVTNAGTMNVNDFKTGVTIEIDGTPYRVLGKVHGPVSMRQQCSQL